MKPKNEKIFGGIGLALSLVAAWAALALAMDSKPEVYRINKERLKGMLGNPGFVLLDVRTEDAWESSDVKIPGAMREDPDRGSSWAPRYGKDQKIILYCSPDPMKQPAPGWRGKW